MSHSSRDFKQQAHALVDRLPRNASWSDLAHQAAARQDLEESELDEDSGHVAEEVYAEYAQMQAEVARSVSAEERESW